MKVHMLRRQATGLLEQADPTMPEAGELVGLVDRVDDAQRRADRAARRLAVAQVVAAPLPAVVSAPVRAYRSRRSAQLAAATVELASFLDGPAAARMRNTTLSEQVWAA